MRVLHWLIHQIHFFDILFAISRLILSGSVRGLLDWTWRFPFWILAGFFQSLNKPLCFLWSVNHDIGKNTWYRHFKLLDFLFPCCFAYRLYFSCLYFSGFCERKLNARNFYSECKRRLKTTNFNKWKSPTFDFDIEHRAELHEAER